MNLKNMPRHSLDGRIDDPLPGLERSLPDEVFRRSEAQHIVSRLVGEARHQHIARANERERARGERS